MCAGGAVRSEVLQKIQEDTLFRLRPYPVGVVRILQTGQNAVKERRRVPMKKNFPLELPNRASARVLEAIKSDVRKYLKRERRKALPEGVPFWDFDCRVGREEGVATVVEVRSLIEQIDHVASEGAKSLYIEILAKPGVRSPREEGDTFPEEQ